MAVPMPAPSGPLPTDFDIVDRLRKAAIEADDMIMDDVVALFREAATVVENLRREMRGASQKFGEGS